MTELHCWTCLSKQGVENPVTMVNEEAICLSCMLQNCNKVVDEGEKEEYNPNL